MSRSNVTSEVERVTSAPSNHKRFYASLWVPVLIAMGGRHNAWIFQGRRCRHEAAGRRLYPLDNDDHHDPHFLHGGDWHRRHAVRGLVNMIGNGVAMLVVARWENELERATLQHKLAQ
ncbi:MAG: hypothetical protein WB660_12415 [Candidatus Sulfotelmatobacter sp.]